MITDRVEKFKEVLDWLDESPLGGSIRPMRYDLERVREYLEGLHDMSPLQVDDDVVLTESIEVDKGHGWYHAQHFLVRGAPGVITDIDWTKKSGWTCYVCFHHESYLTEYDLHGLRTGTKVRRPISDRNKHVYHLKQSKLCRVNEYDGVVEVNPWRGCICTDSVYPYSCEHEDCKTKKLPRVQWHSHGTCPVHPYGDVDVDDEWTTKS